MNVCGSKDCNEHLLMSLESLFSPLEPLARFATWMVALVQDTDCLAYPYGAGVIRLIRAGQVTGVVGEREHEVGKDRAKSERGIRGHTRGIRERNWIMIQVQ